MKQSEDNKTVDMEDVFLWSNGDWCYRYEIFEMKHKSDDYCVLYFGSREYNRFFATKVLRDY